MIKLTRIRSETVIPLVFRGPTRVGWALELLQKQRAIKRAQQTGEALKHEFDAGRWKAVKAQLFAESGDKCAYCEANTKVVAYGDVEHYRPKSKYWWLAYCYDNYLVSCAICNQRYKSDNFPILTGNRMMKGPAVLHNTTDRTMAKWQAHLFPDPLVDEEGMPMATFQALHHTERPLLLNPYHDDPDAYFGWEVHDDLKEIWLVPVNEAAVPFVEAAETYYGLNRQELKNLRYTKFYLFKTFYRSLLLPHLPSELKMDIQQSINTMVANGGEFAGMLRFFLHKWQLTPP